MSYAPPQTPPPVAYISSSHPQLHELPAAVPISHISTPPGRSRAHTFEANNDFKSPIPSPIASEYSEAIELSSSTYTQAPVDHAYTYRLRNARTSSVEYRYELQPTERNTFDSTRERSVPPPRPPPKVLPEIESDTKLPSSLDGQGTRQVELTTQWQSHSHFQSVHPPSWAQLVPGTYYQNPEPPGGHEAPLHSYKHGESAPEVLRGHRQQEWKGAEAPEVAHGQEAPEVAKDQESWPPVGIEAPRLVEVEELPHLWDPSKMEVADSARPLSPSKGDRGLEEDMAISTGKPYSSLIPPGSSVKDGSVAGKSNGVDPVPNADPETLQESNVGGYLTCLYFVIIFILIVVFVAVLLPAYMRM